MSSPDGRDQQACVAAHFAAQLCHPPVGTEHRHQGDPGAARSRQARHHGALYSRTPDVILRESTDHGKVGYTAYREDHETRPTTDDQDIRRQRVLNLHRVQMKLYFEMLDRSCPVGRWATAFFYLGGIGLLLVPSAMVFCQVMRVLAHKAGIG